MKEDIALIVKMITEEKEKKNTLEKNYKKYKDLYGEDALIVRFIKANLENPNNELKKYTTKLTEEKNNVEGELNALKDKREQTKKEEEGILVKIKEDEKNIANIKEETKPKMEHVNDLAKTVLKLKGQIEEKDNVKSELKEKIQQTKKEGRELLDEIKKDKNNIANIIEEQKSRKIQTDNLATAVQELDRQIAEKEKLLEDINISLEIVNDAVDENLMYEYRRKLNEVYEQAKRNATNEKEEVVVEVVENKGWRNQLSKVKNAIKSAIPYSIKNKLNKVKKTVVGLFRKNEITSIQQVGNGDEQEQGQGSKPESIVMKVNDINGEIEYNAMGAMKAKEAKEEIEMENAKDNRV